ncbi:MAG: hypothetical protein SGPRY_003874 [Prymnesium sp.]
MHAMVLFLEDMAACSSALSRTPLIAELLGLEEGYTKGPSLPSRAIALLDELIASAAPSSCGLSDVTLRLLAHLAYDGRHGHAFLQLARASGVVPTLVSSLPSRLQRLGGSESELCRPSQQLRAISSILQLAAAELSSVYSLLAASAKEGGTVAGGKLKEEKALELRSAFTSLHAQLVSSDESGGLLNHLITSLVGLGASVVQPTPMEDSDQPPQQLQLQLYVAKRNPDPGQLRTEQFELSNAVSHAFSSCRRLLQPLVRHSPMLPSADEASRAFGLRLLCTLLEQLARTPSPQLGPLLCECAVPVLHGLAAHELAHDDRLHLVMLSLRTLQPPIRLLSSCRRDVYLIATALLPRPPLPIPHPNPNSPHPQGVEYRHAQFAAHFSPSGNEQLLPVVMTDACHGCAAERSAALSLLSVLFHFEFATSGGSPSVRWLLHARLGWLSQLAAPLAQLESPLNAGLCSTAAPQPAAVRCTLASLTFLHHVVLLSPHTSPPSTSTLLESDVLLSVAQASWLDAWPSHYDGALHPSLDRNRASAYMQLLVALLELFHAVILTCSHTPHHVVSLLKTFLTHGKSRLPMLLRLLRLPLQFEGPSLPPLAPRAVSLLVAQLSFLQAWAPHGSADAILAAARAEFVESTVYLLPSLAGCLAIDDRLPPAEIKPLAVTHPYTSSETVERMASDARDRSVLRHALARLLTFCHRVRLSPCSWQPLMLFPASSAETASPLFVLGSTLSWMGRRMHQLEAISGVEDKNVKLLQEEMGKVLRPLLKQDLEHLNRESALPLLEFVRRVSAEVSSRRGA